MSPREQDCGRKASVLESLKKRHCLDLFRVAAAVKQSRGSHKAREMQIAQKSAIQEW
jgi:hypothetical protein